ncbi:Aerobic glycerol-3-phosphate dehydrogenase [Thalassovita autumnalis]|uniref:Aerobic glycerol-3-phosphate dehydrogenase n=1 Tax=Thalassovita autumnalis TaxID=2072972 RepID=A0A0P1FL76_9RHOB|nr:glycerol-3-phosphate dehydrogenase/oxidase [Thalassovita autumnalis]CUH68892.1 Aerobic glycerol-3-phosphate dehydrogenase [Thalassovita autumnalis]CUH71424.1 Aerobic glycerol-3-phosphate dehydrogenase [Thalassovita autumnalis]
MPDQRTKIWQDLNDDSAFDVVVVGGGVNGIGTYRELALQGLRVLLVERGDFASGCSAAPSRMIHGGLRYLENGEFDLVRESLQERDALLLNAPHMVHPLPTVIPITSTFSGLFNAAASFLGRSGKPARRGALPIKLGLGLYDWVTRKRRLMPKHSFAGRRQTRENWPGLMAEARYTATYHDAWIGFPERLCVEMLQDVAQAAPRCLALNYAEIRKEVGGHTVTCQRSGQSAQVAPRLIINATGAWLDETVTQLGGAAQKRMVEGTKGSHLILDHPELHAALKGSMVFFENDDGRVCIVFPFHDRVLAGSTDIRVSHPGRVRCEPEEQEYILTSLRNVFPGLVIAADQIVFSYSGIRPLPQSDQDFTGRISRGHDIRLLEGTVPQLCMIGGKWTTFRAFAAQAADEAMELLGVTRRTETLQLPIGGGADFAGADEVAQSLQATHGLTPDRAAHLAQRYGSKAAEVAAACGPTDQPLAAATQYSRAEMAHLIRTEFVQNLSDLALRRTDLAISGDLSMQIIEALADVMAEVTSLSADQVAAQKTALIDELTTYHGVDAATLNTRNTERTAQCA